MIAILRIIKLLRPTRIVSYFPFLKRYVEAITLSTRDFLLNLLMLSIILSSLAVLFYAIVYDNLTKRCVPSDLTSPNVLNNVYYREFGESIFYTAYNTVLCGFKYVTISPY